jgi:AraC-like DNA-binding protein
VSRETARVFGAPIPGVHATRLVSGRHFTRHWHDTFSFGLLEDGAQHWASDRGAVRAYPGNVISTNPGEVHDGRPHGAESRTWSIVSVEPEAMTALIGESADRLAIAHPVIEDEALATVLRRLFARLMSRSDALAIEESLVAACTMLFTRHGAARLPTPVPPADLRRVRERLSDLGGPAPALVELAELAGLSRFQVLRRFEQAFGLPPHAWLRRLRTERARSLIRDGRSLAMAAASVGFADQSHMTRAFVQQYGFTPGAWKRASNEAAPRSQVASLTFPVACSEADHSAPRV